MTYADAESTSQYILGDDDRDVDASVRALRPRSSRRGSWESEASRWSARLQGGQGTPKERSLWTSNSMRTGGDNELEDESSDKASQDGGSPVSSGPDALDLDAVQVVSPSVTSDSELTPRNPAWPDGGPSIHEVLAVPSLLSEESSTDTVAHIAAPTPDNTNEDKAGSEGSSTGKNDASLPDGEGQRSSSTPKAETISLSVVT